MKNILQKISKFLPFIAVIVVLTLATSADASIGSWLKDKAETLAATALGLVPVKDCPTPAVDPTTCLFCPMFKILFMAGSGVAKKSYDLFHTALGELILVFLAVSLALMILKNVASFGAKDPGTLLNDLFTKAFVCAAIYIIITQDYFNILNMTIAPIVLDGLSFVGLGSSETTCPYMATMGGMQAKMGAMDGEAMPTEIGEMILCAINNIESKIQTLFSYGEYAWCLGTGSARIFKIIPNPIYLIDGLLLYIGGLLFLIGYPWILADAVLQLGISFAILPFAVAGYAFQGTKNYLSKTFTWILNSLFVFIFMAILVNVVLGYVADLLGLIFKGTGDSKELFENPLKGIAFFGPNMMKILFILAVGWVYMPLVKDLAKNFAPGASLSAAQKTGSVVTNAVDQAAEKVADKAGDLAIDAVKATANTTARRTRALGRQTMLGATRFFGKTDPTTGNKTLSFAGMKYTVEQDSNGNKVLKREFTSVTGRKHVMYSDKYSTIKEEYTASGQLIRRSVRFKHNFIKKHLLDDKGRINTGALQTLLDSPIGQNPAYRQALMEQVANQILKGKGKDIGKYFVSRTVTFNPADPTKITVIQVDHSGKETRFSMDINMNSGQTAISFAQSVGKNNKDIDVFFSNGVVELQTTATRDASGTTTSEVTKFKYSADAQKGHDSLTINDDSNQIVDSTGAIASDLLAKIGSTNNDNPLNLLYGMDNIAGTTSIGGQAMPDFILQNVLKEGRIRHTNKFATAISQFFI